jgi:hypothetical protein
MSFQIVQMIEGVIASVYADNIEDAAHRLGLTLVGIETRRNLRPCLQGQPKIWGFVGPCYGGTVAGIDVIRYEDANVYREVSQ